MALAFDGTAATRHEFVGEHLLARLQYDFDAIDAAVDGRRPQGSKRLPVYTASSGPSVSSTGSLSCG
jgi:hypothetical protein